MGTVGEQLLERVATLERRITDTPVGMTDTVAGIRDELVQLRERVEAIDRTSHHGGNGQSYHSRDPKEWMPHILGDKYRDGWRNWSYKARDWLSQHDASLLQKLEAVEATSTELAESYLESQSISDQTNLSIKRFLVHRLEGEPAEVVRLARNKHGLEQYRRLAQLCDPAAGGRN